MLAKINRLDRKGVTRVKKTKTKIYSPGILVLVRNRRESSAPTRIAIIISKKTARLATTRNAVKRQIKKEVIGSKSILPQGKDLLFLVSSKYISFQPKQKKASIISAITKATNI